MSELLNTSNHLQIYVITITVVAIIAFARKLEKPLFPGILIIINLGLLLFHSYLLSQIPNSMETLISQTYLCLAMDFLWLLISFLGYLWIDDIRAIKFNKKSYDNSMSWFWNKL